MSLRYHAADDFEPRNWEKAVHFCDSVFIKSANEKAWLQRHEYPPHALWNLSWEYDKLAPAHFCNSGGGMHLMSQGSKGVQIGIHLHCILLLMSLHFAPILRTIFATCQDLFP